MINFFRKILDYVKLGISDKIARRYFIVNAFDGSLTLLGMLMGAFIVGIENYHVIFGAGMGATIAMGISGLSGAYLSEKAERAEGIRELEKAMLKKLDNTTLSEASKVAPIFSALAHGGSPFLAGLLIMAPFFFGELFSVTRLVYMSLGLCFGILFLLGLVLGKISKENMFLSGIRALAVGIFTAVILYIFKI